MRGKPFPFWRGEITNALLLVPVAMVGVALPLGYIYQVDGYLKYLRPIELPVVYAWGWIIFGLVGLVLALTTIVPAMGAAWLLRHRPADWAGRIGAWLSLSIIALSLLKGMYLWLNVNEFALAIWMGRVNWELGYATAVGCAVWIWRRPSLPGGLHSLAKLGTIAGLVPVMVAALTALFTPASPSVPPVPPTAAETMERAAKRPNIILLTIDTLAADHMSLYGYERATTPNLERLAQQASVFERFYANSNWTTPSVTSIIHGLRPWSGRAIQLLVRTDADIADRNLVARLKKTGYQTFAVGTNYNAAPSNIRIVRWLDKVAEGRIRGSLLEIVSTALPPHAVTSLQMGVLPKFFEAMEWLRFRLGLFPGADHFDPELALATARDFVAHRDPNRPFFLWVHLLPPHAPYATPPPFVGRFDPRPEARTRFDSSPLPQFEAGMGRNFPDRYVGRYDESIVYVDRHVGRFADWLKETGLFDDSLLVVTADHGESFVKGYGTHNGPLLHDALIRVPLILKEPAQRVGRRLDALAELIDLMPTILDLVSIPSEGAGEGRSLKPAIQGKKITRAVFSMNFEQNDRYGELHTGSVAMIEGRWKYVHYRGQIKYPMMPKLEDSLYDLESDPGEETNLIPAHPAIAAKMLARIQEELRRHGGPVK